VYHQDRYDAFALVAGIEENEVWPIHHYLCAKLVRECLIVLLNEKCES